MRAHLVVGAALSLFAVWAVCTALLLLTDPPARGLVPALPKDWDDPGQRRA